MSLINVTAEGLFNLSPTTALGYGLVIGAGALCISAGFIEKRLFGGSHAYISEWFERLLLIGLPIAYITLVWRLFSAL